MSPSRQTAETRLMVPTVQNRDALYPNDEDVTYDTRDFNILRRFQLYALDTYIQGSVALLKIFCLSC